MRAVALASGVLFACACWAQAGDEQTIDFAGETYHLAYQDEAQRENATITEALAELTLQGQTVNDWTKLFAFHAYPTAGNDPATATAMLGRVVKEGNKDANFAITKVPDSDESIIDFLTWAPGSDVMEFDVFKYAKDASGKGLVALQYAQHIKTKDMTVADFRKVRERMVEKTVGTDISPARDYFSDEGHIESPGEDNAGKSDD